MSAPTPASTASATDALPLRVVLACGNYNYLKDGAAFVLNMLVRHLEERQIPVMILSPVVGPPAFESFGEVTRCPRCPCPAGPSTASRSPSPRRSAPASRRFDRRSLHVASPDPLGYSAIALARRMGVPVVASYHARHDLTMRYWGMGFLAPAWQRFLARLYAPCARLRAHPRGR